MFYLKIVAPLRRGFFLLACMALLLCAAGVGRVVELPLLRMLCMAWIAFECIDWWHAFPRAATAGMRASPCGAKGGVDLPALVAYIDANQRYRFCNHSHAVIAGDDPHTLIGKTVCEVFGSSGYAVLAPELGVALHGEHTAFERTLSIGSLTIDAHVEFVPDLTPGGQVRGVYVVIIDLSARKRMEAALLAEGAQMDALLEAIEDALVITDKQGLITYMNPAAQQLSGWDNAEASGRECGAVLVLRDGATRALTLPMAWASFSAPYHYRDTVLLRRNGDYAPVEGTAVPIRDAEQQVAGTVLLLHDVSEASSLAAELTYQATHDALTGLINRREFEQRVQRAAIAARERGGQHAMLYIDLDQFKIVNDTCGHAAGDALLKQLSRVLQACLRSTDTLGRLGGDEFGVLLTHCGEAPAVRAAEELRRTVRDFNFTWRDQLFPIGASIGLVIFGGDGLELNDVLRMADAACYLAKDKGRNQWRVYKEDDLELMQRRGELDWASRIHSALNDNRFVLYKQPVYSLRGEGVPHYEVLLRMLGEDGGLVPPMAFLPAAERYGLMGLIDRWVVRHALLDLATRNPPGSTPVELCAINLSGASIGGPAMLAYICEQLASCQVAPQAVCFEITETAAISNLADAAELIRKLAAMGCSFSLDDFGSGMSSFGYLKHLPVNYLKIDGEFVKDMLDDPIDRAMVAAINQIGHVMGIQTIAEFVESPEILAELRAMGIDYAQGFAVQAPQPMLPHHWLSHSPAAAVQLEGA